MGFFRDLKHDLGVGVREGLKSAPSPASVPARTPLPPKYPQSAGGAARAGNVPAPPILKPMKCGVVLVAGDTVTDNHGTLFPLKGATARVGTGAQIGSRVTATRILALGVFALVAKKNQSTIFLTIDSANGRQTIIEELRAKNHELQARRFVADFNARAKKA